MRKLLIGTDASLLAIGAPGRAQIIPAEEALADLYPGRAYSPYAERDFPDRVFWGDTHLHTRLSADAGLFGNTARARGGLPLRPRRGGHGRPRTSRCKLSRPLDWLVIADHSDMMGFSEDLASGAPNVLAYPDAKSGTRACRPAARLPPTPPST